MPSVFLSPSTEEHNEFVIGNTEEYYMNLIADALEPYLTAAGISFGRNNPAFSVGHAISLSNIGNYDVYLSLHTNTAPPRLFGRIQGLDAYYYPGSAAGEALAQLIVTNLRSIYPYPDLVNAVPNRTHYELITSRAAPVLVELAYHDNEEDAQWIADNIESIARALALSLTQYFGVPFVLPNTLQRGRVDTEGFDIYLREQPDFNAAVGGVLLNGADVIVTGESGDWYVVTYNGQSGFVPRNYITLL